MADINHIISLGIGSPAGIPEFLTLGLQIGAAVVSTTPDGRIYHVAGESRVYLISGESRLYPIAGESRLYPIPGDD